VFSCNRHGQYLLLLLSFKTWQFGQKTFLIEFFELYQNLKRAREVGSKNYSFPRQESL
jgi:hypothetical protein